MLYLRLRLQLLSKSRQGLKAFKICGRLEVNTNPPTVSNTFLLISHNWTCASRICDSKNCSESLGERLIEDGSPGPPSAVAFSEVSPSSVATIISMQEEVHQSLVICSLTTCWRSWTWEAASKEMQGCTLSKCSSLANDMLWLA